MRPIPWNSIRKSRSTFDENLPKFTKKWNLFTIWILAAQVLNATNLTNSRNLFSYEFVFYKLDCIMWLRGAMVARLTPYHVGVKLFYQILIGMYFWCHLSRSFQLWSFFFSTIIRCNAINWQKLVIIKKMKSNQIAELHIIES